MPHSFGSGSRLEHEVERRLGRATELRKSAALHDHLAETRFTGLSAQCRTSVRERVRHAQHARRALAQLEREIPRARALLEESAALIAGSGVEAPGTTLGLGIVHWFEGDVARGTEFIERALVQALRAKGTGREQAAEAVAAAEAISRRSAVCRARAALGRTLLASADAEAVREAHRAADAPFDRVWTGVVFKSTDA